MISVLLLIGIVAWIIKDHRAVMAELKEMREIGKPVDRANKSDIIIEGTIQVFRSN